MLSNLAVFVVSSDLRKLISKIFFNFYKVLVGYLNHLNIWFCCNQKKLREAY